MEQSMLQGHEAWIKPRRSPRSIMSKKHTAAMKNCCKMRMSILSTLPLRIQTTMKSLQHHKHVLCEKAITVNARQLKEIIDIAKEKQLIVSEAMTIYHMPLYKKLREIVKEGRIGPLWFKSPSERANHTTSLTDSLIKNWLAAHC
ncbi:hypothetical protein STZ1_20981 [Bacillus subtilis]